MKFTGGDSGMLLRLVFYQSLHILILGSPLACWTLFPCGTGPIVYERVSEHSRWTKCIKQLMIPYKTPIRNLSSNKTLENIESIAPMLIACHTNVSFMSQATNFHLLLTKEENFLFQFSSES